jgi:hypothetical protein
VPTQIIWRIFHPGFLASRFIPSAARQDIARLELPINFGTMLNAIDADDLLGMINPIENSLVAGAQFAETSELIRHAGEAPMR